MQRLQNSQNARTDAMAHLQSARGECGEYALDNNFMDDMYEKENSNSNMHGSSDAKSAAPLSGALTPTLPGHGGHWSPRHPGRPRVHSPPSSARSPLPRSGMGQSVGAPNSPTSLSRLRSGSCPTLAWEPGRTSLDQITEEEDIGSSEHSPVEQAVEEEFRHELASARAYYTTSSQEFTNELESVQSFTFSSQVPVQSLRRIETSSKPGCSGSEHHGAESGPQKPGSRTPSSPGLHIASHAQGTWSPSFPVQSPRSTRGGRALALTAAGPVLVRSVPSEGCCVLGGVPARGVATCSA